MYIKKQRKERINNRCGIIGDLDLGFIRYSFYDSCDFQN